MSHLPPEQQHGAKAFLVTGVTGDLDRLAVA
jgi:hypothetical protein